MRRLTLALTLAVGAFPQAARADTAATGTLERGPGPFDVVFRGQNTGDQPIRGMNLSFNRVNGVTITSQPSGAICFGDHDSAANRSFVGCIFDPPVWPPGGNIQVGFTTDPALPGDADAELKVCASPCDAAADRGPFPAPGPDPPAPPPERVAEIKVTKLMYVVDRRIGEAAPGDVVRVEIRVRNKSGRRLTGVNVRDDLPRGLRLVGSRRSGNVFECGPFDLGERDPGDVHQCEFRAELVARGEGAIANEAVAGAPRQQDGTTVPTVRDADELRHSDPRAIVRNVDADSARGGVERFIDPNTAPGFTEEVLRAPIFGAGNPRRTITRVEVAIRRAAGKQRCKWVGKGPKPKLRTKKCNRGIWLRAKGTKRWRFDVPSGLPAGRYKLYARARNEAGAVQRSFGRPNTGTFRVR